MGLRVRFSATHECEYDSMEPCSSLEVFTWFKGREDKASSLREGKVVRVGGHSVVVTTNRLLVVRK